MEKLYCYEKTAYFSKNFLTFFFEEKSLSAFFGKMTKFLGSFKIKKLQTAPLLHAVD